MMNFFKNIIQKLIALLLIIITFPIQIIISILIFLELKEFPLFFQKRGLTIEKNLFRIIKFKTISSKDSKIIQHKNSDDIFYLNKKIKIKPISKFLRLTGLDELPQLYNILIGDMNFIGPRPLMIEELNILKKNYLSFYNIRNTISSKPGLTGLWQIIGDRKNGIDELVGLEMFYERHRSVKLNLKIIYYSLVLNLTANNSDALIPRLEYISKFSSMKINKFKLNYEIHNKLNYSFYINLPVNWLNSDFSLGSTYKMIRVN